MFNISNSNSNVYWANIYPHPIKGLNLIDNAPVNKDFMKNMSFIGTTTKDIFFQLFDDDDKDTLSWYWEHKNLSFDDTLLVFKAVINHHLRKTKTRSLHIETWLFILISASDNNLYLCPVKRDSDFNFDIFAKLEQLCKIEISGPWLRHSSAT
jgi:hypothetical protein